MGSPLLGIVVCLRVRGPYQEMENHPTTALSFTVRNLQASSLQPEALAAASVPQTAMA